MAQVDITVVMGCARLGALVTFLMPFASQQLVYMIASSTCVFLHAYQSGCDMCIGESRIVETTIL